MLTLTPVGAGGFATEVAVTAAVELFVTVMVSVNWQPVPTLNVDGTRVMDKAFNVHETQVLTAGVPAEVMTAQVPPDPVGRVTVPLVDALTSGAQPL